MSAHKISSLLHSQILIKYNAMRQHFDTSNKPLVSFPNSKSKYLDKIFETFETVIPVSFFSFYDAKTSNHLETQLRAINDAEVEDDGARDALLFLSFAAISPSERLSRLRCILNGGAALSRARSNAPTWRNVVVGSSAEVKAPRDVIGGREIWRP